MSDVYTRISHKAHKEINDLTAEERDALENLLTDDYSESVSRADDETLLQMGMDKGVIL